MSLDMVSIIKVDTEVFLILAYSSQKFTAADSVQAGPRDALEDMFRLKESMV